MISPVLWLKVYWTGRVARARTLALATGDLTHETRYHTQGNSR
jgi:hypothetical protein